MLSKRAQNRVELRTRILNAARQLFGERGFEQVTMSEVAAAAGVSRATVFNYFPAKYNLVEAITEEVFAYFSAMLNTALAHDQHPTPVLVRALFSHMAGIEMYRSFYSGVFREIVRLRVGLDEGGDAGRMREASLQLLEQLMARGQERGELLARVSAAELAQAFDSLTNGTIVHWLYEDASDSLRARLERTADIFLGAVATDGGASRGEPLPELVTPSDAPESPLAAVRRG
ncbi:MAG: TetR/AcrR family transcriptional regulator [Proteobacteria bacterium]|nr:TetR/AcrR family transcriptional regulator [Pseudomonadota bacterium]